MGDATITKVVVGETENCGDLNNQGGVTRGVRAVHAIRQPLAGRKLYCQIHVAHRAESDVAAVFSTTRDPGKSL